MAKQMTWRKLKTSSRLAMSRYPVLHEACDATLLPRVTLCATSALPAALLMFAVLCGPASISKQSLYHTRNKCISLTSCGCLLKSCERLIAQRACRLGVSGALQFFCCWRGQASFCTVMSCCCDYAGEACDRPRSRSAAAGRDAAAAAADEGSEAAVHC